MNVLLFTPPFTQLNTPYPATAYIKGFLNTLNIRSFQADLGLEVILELFCSNGIKHIFEAIDVDLLSDNGKRVFSQRHRYTHTIDPVILFLQNKNPTLAHTICSNGYLPKAGRFNHSDGLEWAFGSMGTHDKARHLATLYLEDLGDLITEAIDEHFGFSRYAERLARTASSFDALFNELHASDSLVTDILIQLVEKYIDEQSPNLVCITVPFPGNVFGAFKIGQYIKQNHPAIKIALGGGYANTELRSVYDERVFEFVDYIMLDDGEAPLQHLIRHLQGEKLESDLKRTFALVGGVVNYCNGSKALDIPQREVGTPDYSDLLLHDYLSVIEVANPMHRMWSDGRWNKLTLAHGCYWGKCSFCDVTLDYIKRYEPISAEILCDRIATIIEQTGQHGFHFVDEAAPPALMRDLAIEIIKRNITVVWWTNIRFEKSFTNDLCRLLRASGCIAISGGLEVASDRLLGKMKKGVTVSQVAKVAHAFTESGIMVHAYLMYGFPTQSAQETIDSLEMVRQMILNGVIQSGFWHQFAMTAHSPVGLDPASFGVKSIGPKFDGFAENDLYHDDMTGADHELFSDGLKVSMFNYMQGAGLEEDLDIWFEFDVPETSVAIDYIQRCLEEETEIKYRDNDLVVWIGGEMLEKIELNNKKGKKGVKENLNYAQINISGLEENYTLYFESKVANWVVQMIELSRIKERDKFTFKDFRESYEQNGLTAFETFMDSDSFGAWNDRGLLIL